MGRLFETDQDWYLRDWSGEVALTFPLGTTAIRRLALIQAHGIWDGNRLVIDSWDLLGPDPSECNGIEQQNRTGGPERALLDSDFTRRIQLRTDFVRCTRRYFDDLGFQEVETPCLVTEPGCDPHIHLFETRYKPLAGAGPATELYLHTSPELAMKRLLVSGAKAIYRIGPVFRNGEADATHRPEFLMLEWYRVGDSLEDLMDVTEGLFQLLDKQARSKGFQPPPLPSAFPRLPLRDIFLEATRVDPLETFEPTDFAKLLMLQGLGPYPDHSTYSQIFHQVWVEVLETQVMKYAPCFLFDYPAPLALLSRFHPTEPRLARRVEAFLGGLELANGFEELTDPVEQRHRFEEDRTQALQEGRTPAPIPEDFLRALELGCPPSAGIAVGLDRLVQVATGASELADVNILIIP